MASRTFLVISFEGLSVSGLTVEPVFDKTDDELAALIRAGAVMGPGLDYKTETRSKNNYMFALRAKLGLVHAADMEKVTAWNPSQLCGVVLGDQIIYMHFRNGDIKLQLSKVVLKKTA